MRVDENASRHYKPHLNISERWRFKCILHSHALFPPFPVNCIDLLRVRGFTVIDQGNSLTQQNCVTSQGGSIPPLLPFGYIMVIHLRHLNSIRHSLRKETEKESPIFLEKVIHFWIFPTLNCFWTWWASYHLIKCLASFSSSLENSVPFQDFTKHGGKNFKKMLNSFRKPVSVCKHIIVAFFFQSHLPFIFLLPWCNRLSCKLSTGHNSFFVTSRNWRTHFKLSWKITF